MKWEAGAPLPPLATALHSAYVKVGAADVAALGPDFK